MDNYGVPGETLKGSVVDVVTGDPVYADVTNNSTRIRLMELSWTATAVPNNYDFPCMRDGTFNNTKLFKGYYNIRIDGPFIPLVRLNQQGDTIADESRYVEISGVTDVKFQVQPFLKIEWVGTPTIDAAKGTITASFKVTRAVSPDDFKAKIEPMGGYDPNFLNVTDIKLFISESSYVGLNDSNGTPYTVTQNYSGNDFDSLLGQTITLTSNGVIAKGRTVFIRAAARISYQTQGVSRYNYNAAVRVDMPQ